MIENLYDDDGAPFIEAGLRTFGNDWLAEVCKRSTDFFLSTEEKIQAGKNCIQFLFYLKRLEWKAP